MKCPAARHAASAWRGESRVDVRGGAAVPLSERGVAAARGRYRGAHDGLARGLRAATPLQGNALAGAFGVSRIIDSYLTGNGAEISAGAGISRQCGACCLPRQDGTRACAEQAAGGGVSRPISMLPGDPEWPCFAGSIAGCGPPWRHLRQGARFACEFRPWRCRSWSPASDPAALQSGCIPDADQGFG